MRQQTGSPLQQLPIELLLRLLRYLDVQAIVRLSSVCQSFYRQSLNEAFWKDVAFIHCDAQSSGNDAVVRDRLRLQDNLPQAIRMQKSTQASFNGVRTWFELVKRRYRIDQNWLKDPLSSQNDLAVSPCCNYIHGIWRFKLDPLYQSIVNSTGDGKIHSSSLSNRSSLREPTEDPFPSPGALLLWSFEPDMQEWPYHLEGSAGYLCHTALDEIFIWRRANIRSCLPAPLFGGQQGGTPAAHDSFFVPHIRMRPPKPIRCYKLRYPYLVAGTKASHPSSETRMFVWDLRDGQLVSQFSVAGEVHPGTMVCYKSSSSLRFSGLTQLHTAICRADSRPCLSCWLQPCWHF